jgi:hypothetical protein
MITAVVRFRLPEGTTRDDAKAMFEKSAPNYRGVPGLVRKYYLYGDDRTGGGVYLWNSREAAERFYSEAWKSTIAQRYGAQPEISFYEALPSWDSKTRWNNLSGGLAVNVTAGPSGRTNSPHPSSREGHHSTVRWISGFSPI